MFFVSDQRLKFYAFSSMYACISATVLSAGIARIEEIKYELSKPIDDEYIIKIARERLGYVAIVGERFYGYCSDKDAANEIEE